MQGSAASRRSLSMHEPPTAALFNWLIGQYVSISLREFCGTELCIVMPSPADCNQKPRKLTFKLEQLMRARHLN